MSNKNIKTTKGWAIVNEKGKILGVYVGIKPMIFGSVDCLVPVDIRPRIRKFKDALKHGG